MHVTLNDARSLVPALIAPLNDNAPAERTTSIELVSPPGVGKSDFVHWLRAYLSKRDGFEWGLFEMFLATYTPPDLMGYLHFEKNEDGTARSVFSTPAWMYDKQGRHISQFKRSLVFMDEFGQGEGDVKRASAQLVLKGELGPHVLPEGAVVIAASNRASDRSGVTKSFDFVINRRLELHITPDVTSWLQWASENAVHPSLIAFAKLHSDAVFGGLLPKEQGPFCTPRSLVMLGTMLERIARANNPTATQVNLPYEGPALAVIQGMIGVAAGQQFATMMVLQTEAPSFEEIVADPKGVRVPEAIDAQVMVTYALAHRVDDKTIEPVITYVDRLPADFALTFVNSVIARTPKIIQSPALMKWISKNNALISAVAISHKR